MGSGDDPIGVDTLGRTANDGLEVILEIGGLEVGVEFLGGQVTQVLGKVGGVVTAETPRQLVFGEVAWDELDRVEGVCFTGLSGCENPIVDHFLRYLGSKISFKLESPIQSPATYVVAVNLLLTNLLEKVVDLVLGDNSVVGKNHLVQSAVIEDDAGHVATNVSQVCDGGRSITVAHEFIVGCGHGVVDPARFETRVGELVPPTDIDDGVGQVELLNVVVDSFFL